MFLLVSVRHVGAHPAEHQHASPYKSLYVWVKNFFGYLVYEIFLWPESWRGSLYMYLLSFPRLWTLCIERFWFLFWQIYFEWFTLKTSNCEHKWIQVYSYINLKLSLFAFFRKCWMINTSWWGKRKKMLTLFLNDLKAESSTKLVQKNNERVLFIA